jgi:hypothetical protein
MYLLSTLHRNSFSVHADEREGGVIKLLGIGRCSECRDILHTGYSSGSGCGDIGEFAGGIAGVGLDMSDGTDDTIRSRAEQ